MSRICDILLFLKLVHLFCIMYTISMDELDLDNIEDTLIEPETYLEPISSNPLPSNTTVGSVLSFEDTLKGNVDEFDAFILFELKKRYPEATYEQITQMAKDPALTDSVKTQLKKEAQTNLEVTNELTPPSVPISNETPILTNNESFFKEKSLKFNSTTDTKIEVVPEEFGNIENVYIGGGYNTEAFKNMYYKGVYGDAGNIPTYFTTDYTTACSHIRDTQPVLLEINLK